MRYTIQELNAMSEKEFTVRILEERRDRLTNFYSPLAEKLRKAIKSLGAENDNDVKIKALCEKMKECAEETGSVDYERAHIKADDILCEALKLLGCTELVELYAQVDKWYA